jgi:hypothetical protein
MNSNQRSEANNQSNNGANEKAGSSSRSGVTADQANLNPQSQQSGTQGGSQQQGSAAQQSGTQSGQQSGSQAGQDSTDRAGSQTGSSQQGMPGQRQSNDVAGGMPKSPRGSGLAADEKMDDDTGLSNTANRQSTEVDQGSRQQAQSNVGRRDDGTPD